VKMEKQRLLGLVNEQEGLCSGSRYKVGPGSVSPFCFGTKHSLYCMPLGLRERGCEQWSAEEPAGSSE
jgi:hypothetical protein